MMKLENHHLVPIVIIIDSGKNHQWMIELVVEKFDKEQDICIVFR